MPVAINDAGEAVFLTPEGEWKPTKIAENPQTKERLAFDGKDWVPVKLPPRQEYSAGDVGMAALRGIPIAGGFVERMSSPESQRGYKEFDEAHPFISGAAKLGGGIAALGPLGVTATGARLLGMTGPTLLRQALNSAASGAGIGAADAAARGDDIATGAQVGGAVGLAGPAVGRVVGKMLGGAQNVVTPVNRTAANSFDVAGVRVPLEAGQASGDVIGQRFVESARKGVLGEAAMREADQFGAIQKQRIGGARDAIGQRLRGAAVNPREAADIAQQSLQERAAAAKAAYQNKYDEFGNLQGEVHAGAFENIGQKIKGALLNADVVVDDVTTPVASRMIQHIDNSIGRMRIQNRADPFGPPNPENVVGVSLKGLDQVRKQLRSMAGAATINPSDRRAASSIFNAFDDHLQDAVNGGLYSGDPNALGTLLEARKLFSAYMNTFKSKGQGDVAGQIVERILGKHGQPATHEQIANWLYGASKVGGNAQSMHVANKLRDVFGAKSPEWQAVRQGLFSKLVDTVEGKITDGPQKVSQRVFEFLNGSGKQLAESMFTPHERALIDQYGQLMKKLTPAAGVVNYSNTGHQIASMMKWTANALAAVAGLHVGGPIGMLAGVASNVAGKGMIEGINAKAVARQLYNSPQQLSSASDRTRKLQSAGGLLGRAVLGVNAPRD